jgi:hypothetical protein
MHGFGILKLNSYKNLSISIFYFFLEFADFVKLLKDPGTTLELLAMDILELNYWT